MARVSTFQHLEIGNQYFMESEYNLESGNLAFERAENFLLNEGKKLSFRNGFYRISSFDGAFLIYKCSTNVINPRFVVFADSQIAIYTISSGTFTRTAILASPYTLADLKAIPRISLQEYGNYLFIDHVNHYPAYIDFGAGIPVFRLFNDSNGSLFITKAKRAFSVCKSSATAGFYVKINSGVGSGQSGDISITLANAQGQKPTFKFAVGNLLCLYNVLLDSANKIGAMVLEIKSLSTATVPTNIVQVQDIINDPSLVDVTIGNATSYANGTMFIVGNKPTGAFSNANAGAVATLNVVSNVASSWTFSVANTTFVAQLVKPTNASTIDAYYGSTTELYTYNTGYGDTLVTDFFWQKWADFNVPDTYTCSFVIINTASIPSATLSDIKIDMSGYYKQDSVVGITNAGSQFGAYVYPQWGVECWTGNPDAISANPLVIPYPTKVRCVADRLWHGSYNGALNGSNDVSFNDFSFGTKAGSAFNGYVNFDDGITDPILNIFTTLYNGTSSMVISNGRQCKLAPFSGSSIDITQLGFVNYHIDGGVSDIPVAQGISEMGIAYIDRTKTKVMCSMYNEFNKLQQPVNISYKNPDMMIASDGTTISKIMGMCLAASYQNIYYVLKDDGELFHFICDGGYQQELTKALGRIVLGSGTLTAEILSIDTIDAQTSGGIESLLLAVVKLTDALDTTGDTVYYEIVAFRQSAMLAARWVDDYNFLDFQYTLTSTEATRRFTGVPAMYEGQTVFYYNYDTPDGLKEAIVTNGIIDLGSDAATTKIIIGFKYSGYLKTTNLYEVKKPQGETKVGDPQVALGVVYTKNPPEVGGFAKSGEPVSTQIYNNTVVESEATKKYYDKAMLRYTGLTGLQTTNGLTNMTIRHSGGGQCNIVCAEFEVSKM